MDQTSIAWTHFTDFVSHDHKTHVILSSGPQIIFRSTTIKIKKLDYVTFQIKAKYL